MPVIDNDIVCVTVAELERIGLAGNDIYRLIIRQDSGEVSCWPYHKSDGRLYIHYAGIREKYKEQIRNTLCGGLEPAVWILKEEQRKQEEKLMNIFRNLSKMVVLSNDDVELLNNTGFYGQQDVQRIARTAGWLRLYRKMDVKTARSYGFTSVKDIQTELFKQCLNEQRKGFVKFPKPVNCERVFDRKAREFARLGISCLISGCFGNANRKDIDSRVHASLMELASRPICLSFEDIAMYYNGTAKDNGLPKQTVSAIKQHLNTPANKRVWMYHRYGKYAGDQLFQPEILREDVSRPDALWSIDGTTMQLYYKGGDGKIRSDLYVYFITDVYSSAIIGWSVAFSETGGMVAEALKYAIENYGYAPYQIQYDNSSANLSAAIRGIMDNMSHVHFACKPLSGRSKYVESYIGHFQQRVLRKDEAFKGGNITAKSLRSRANPDLLKEFSTGKKELRTEQEVIERFAEAVNEWNSRGEKRDAYGQFAGDSKLNRYLHEYEGRKQLNYFEKISLLMSPLPKPYTYGRQGIKIILGGKQHNFIVPDGDELNQDFEFNRLHLGEKFNVRINPLNPVFITLFQKGKMVATAIEKEKYPACVLDIKNNEGSGAKIKQFLQKQEQYGYEYAVSELEKQREILFKHCLKPTGTDGFGWEDTPKPVYNKRQEVAQDALNGIANDTSEITEFDSERMALLNW